MFSAPRSERGSASLTPLMAIGVLWLLVQNTLLLAFEAGRVDPAPLVVARAMMRVVFLVAARYPVLIGAMIVAAGLAVYLGVEVWRGGTAGSPGEGR